MPREDAFEAIEAIDARLDEGLFRVLLNEKNPPKIWQFSEQLAPLTSDGINIGGQTSTPPPGKQTG